MRPQSQEYLRFINKLLHFRKDVPLNAIQNELQKKFDSEIGGIAKHSSFLERYYRTEASMHVHCSVRIIPSGSRYLKLCATIQHLNGPHAKAAGIPNTFLFSCPGSNDVQVSVFVDVRQLGKKVKRIADEGVFVVRLHTLDECVRLCGNVRKSAFELSLRHREGIGSFQLSERRNFRKKRKLAILGPVVRERSSVLAMLDEIERQVIQGRSQLINHLPDQDGNFSRRRDRDIQLLFALRLSDDFVRLTSGINGNAFLNSSEVFLSPDELKFCRLDPVDHKAEGYQRNVG